MKKQFIFITLIYFSIVVTPVKVWAQIDKPIAVPSTFSGSPAVGDGARVIFPEEDVARDPNMVVPVVKSNNSFAYGLGAIMLVIVASIAVFLLRLQKQTSKTNSDDDKKL